MRNEEVEEWVPQTELGKKVKSGEITDINYALRSDKTIMEPEIVDYLLDNLEDEVIMIGGTPGKGGGKRRIASKRTVRMHKSGRRFKSKSLVVIGNKNGVIGIGEGEAKGTREAIEKAKENAKLNIFEIRRGCGSWECGCGEPHSIPLKTTGKSGSVEVDLLPAPRGIGICGSEEIKKVVKLSGITDIWINTRGKTRTRENLIKALLNALENLNKIKMGETKEKVLEGPK